MFGTKDIHTRFLSFDAVLQAKLSTFKKVDGINNYIAQHRLFRYAANFENS
jgi:hypothetical protein